MLMIITISLLETFLLLQCQGQSECLKTIVTYIVTGLGPTEYNFVNTHILRYKRGEYSHIGQQAQGFDYHDRKEFP